MQEAPHLRRLLPTLGGSRHDALREMQSGALEVPEIPSCAETTNEMSKREFVCGVISAPGQPPTSAARLAKTAMLSRSDKPPKQDCKLHKSNRTLYYLHTRLSATVDSARTRKDYGRSNGRVVIWQAGRDGFPRQGQSLIPRCPQQPMLAAVRVAPECDTRLRCQCSVRPSDLPL